MSERATFFAEKLRDMCESWPKGYSRLQVDELYVRYYYLSESQLNDVARWLVVEKKYLPMAADWEEAIRFLGISRPRTSPSSADCQWCGGDGWMIAFNEKTVIDELAFRCVCQRGEEVAKDTRHQKSKLPVKRWEARIRDEGWRPLKAGTNAGMFVRYPDPPLMYSEDGTPKKVSELSLNLPKGKYYGDHEEEK